MSDELKQKRGLQRYQDWDEDDDSGRGTSGGTGGTGGSGGMSLPDIDIFGGHLKTETVQMENERRLMEQAGHRRYAEVKTRERSNEKAIGGQELLAQDIKQHPLLQSQKFDGIDNSLNPAPPNNPDALAEFENHRAEQELQKQLRLNKNLENAHRYSNTPTPKPM